jgi:mRNA interferase MazF
MAYVGRVWRWDLFAADLEPTVGSEQAGERRPVLVVSNDRANAAFRVVTVIPLTKQEGKRREVYPFEVLLPAGVAGNPLDSIAMPQQVRTIDKARLLERLGSLTSRRLRGAVEDALLEHLGIELDE